MARNGGNLVELRGNTYYEAFSYDGVRYRETLHTNDKELAEAKATAHLAELQRAKLLGPKSDDENPLKEMTLDAALGKYWLEHASFLPSATVIELHIVVLRAALDQTIFLSAISPGMLNDYAAQRRVGKITHAPQSARQDVPVSTATVNCELSVLRAVMNRAKKKWNVRVADIEWKDVLLEQNSERQHILTREDDTVDKRYHSNQPDEEARLFDALRLDFHATTRFGLLSGLRVSNIVNLIWDQIKWSEGLIEVRLKSKKPGGRLHYVPITDAIREILLGEVGRHPTRVFTFICAKSDRRHNQVKGQRYPISKGNFQREWNRARREAGLYYGEKRPENLRIHDLRHTAATRALKKCHNIRTVQKLLGHSNVLSTLRYLKTDIDDVRDAME